VKNLRTEIENNIIGEKVISHFKHGIENNYNDLE
jgi:hypothetical protein